MKKPEIYLGWAQIKVLLNVLALNAVWRWEVLELAGFVLLIG
jgi:hypothetical protein|tara:strand:+ start:69 stop:194 length:126 start_codon:yes stop_codon:yes gene_type:complete